MSLCASSALGCGGRAVTESDPEGEVRQSTDGADRSPAPAPGDDNADPHDLDSTIELGDCEPGWRRGEALCPWLGSDELCYPTKEAACACLCPAHGETTCTSGLPGGENDEVRVSCD